MLIFVLGCKVCIFYVYNIAVFDVHPSVGT